MLLSEDVVARGDFLSLHLVELEVNVYNTEMGEERTTSDLPAVSLKHKDHLPADGIATTGTVVREGDVLVGKLRPTRQRSRFQRIRQPDAAVEIFVDDATSDEDSGDIGSASAAAYVAAGNGSDTTKVIRCAVDTSLRVPKDIKLASVVEVSRACGKGVSFFDKLGDCVESYTAIRKRYARRVCAVNKRAEGDTSLDSKVQDELTLLSASYDAEIENLFQNL